MHADQWSIALDRAIAAKIDYDARYSQLSLSEILPQSLATGSRFSADEWSRDLPLRQRKVSQNERTLGASEWAMIY
jgi:hypothetical protein